MDKLVVTPEVAANALHMRINDLKDRLESGEIPAYRDGRNWKIPIECLKRYPVERAIKEANDRRGKNESAAARDNVMAPAD